MAPITSKLFPARQGAAASKRASTGFVEAELHRLRSTRAGPLQRNRAFNAGYQRLATAVQTIVSPGARQGVLPNWFALGSHASPVVGHGLLAAERGRAAVTLAQEGRLSQAALQKLYPQASDRERIERWEGHMTTLGFEPASALAGAIALDVVASASGQGSAPSVRDPRVKFAILKRFRAALGPEPLAGGSVAARLGDLLATFETLMAQGNLAIFSDIAAAGDRFLSVRQDAGRALRPEEIFERVPLEGASLAGSRKAYAFARANLASAYKPLWFDREVPSAHSNDLMRAAFALYEDAGASSSLPEKNALIAMANSLVAWREQKVVVQPAFEGPGVGGISRNDVLSIVSPLVGIDFGKGVTWSAAESAAEVRKGDGKAWTARSSEYQWGDFNDRWPLILAGFRKAYATPGAVWDMPNPDVRLG